MQVEHTPLHVNLKLKSKKTDFVFALVFFPSPSLLLFCVTYFLCWCDCCGGLEVLKRETVTQFQSGAVRK